jgi:hypothetical protein
MAYAVKHGYREIVDKAAPSVVSLPVGDAVKLLPQHLVVPWVCLPNQCCWLDDDNDEPHFQVIYRQQWYDVLLNAIRSQPSGTRNTLCKNCARGNVTWDETLNLNLNISSLSSFANEADEAKRRHPSSAREIDSWHKNIQAQMDGIQKFSDFV